MDCSYIVTVKDVGNITNDPRNIHTILTSTDNIAPRERVEVVPMAEPLGLENTRHNPSFTPELEETIRLTVERIELDENVTIIAMMPVKYYPTERAWIWAGFILIETDGSTRAFDLTGTCHRVSSAYRVPR